MNRLETNIRYLPNAYQCAIETLGAYGERTAKRLDALCEHYERACGLLGSKDSAFYRQSAAAIAARRFPDWQPAQGGQA